MKRCATLGLTLAGLLFSIGGPCPAKANGAAPTACTSARFEGDGFVVCRYVAKVDELKLAAQTHGAPFGDFVGLERSLGRDAARVSFAMNAGMYDRRKRPVGLFVKAGRVDHPLNRGHGDGNFYLEPNGVFWVDGSGLPHIDESGAYAARGARPSWATQSGPLLLKGGALNPHISVNGPSLLVRNGVGTRAGAAFFVISDGPVSFGRFARFFREGLDCRDALYLDGTVSSLWAPALVRRDARTGLGTFVIVLHRRPLSR